MAMSTLGIVAALALLVALGLAIRHAVRKRRREIWGDDDEWLGD